MRMQLAGWCVLLAVAGSCIAADKPKKGKPKPTSPPPAVEEFAKPTEAPPTGGIGSVAGAIIGQATGNPKTGAVVGPLGGGVVGSLVGKDADRDDTKFTICKPVGTWVRDVRMKDGAVRVHLTVQDDRLTLKVEMAGGVNGCIVTESGCVELTADYSINKESCLYGVVDTFGTDQPLTGDAAKVLRLSGQPFCVRFRSDEKTLSLKDFKGFGVGTGAEAAEGVGELLLAVCGQYTAVDPKKPLPPLKSANPQETDATPHLTPTRIHGGILKADPPKGEVLSSRLDRVPLPTPHYLKHYPTYFAPEPAFPLQRERDAMLDPTGEIRRGGTALSPTVGDKPNSDPPKDAKTPILPPIRKGEKPECEAPTDAEVMRVFKEILEQVVGKDFELAQDDIVIVKNIVKDKIGPPRFYPIVGFAQLHEVSWECGVYYNDTRGGKRKPKVEVIQLDKDHLHLYVGENPHTQRDALLELTK